MARIRTIKPEFPHSESMGKVSRDARLTFIQLWTLADDDGRLRGNSRLLASLLFPYDKDVLADPALMDGWLDELEREKCIDRYAAEGGSYIQIRNWLSHQKIDHPSKSKLPSNEENSRELSKHREEQRLDLDLDQDLKKKDVELNSTDKLNGNHAEPPGDLQRVFDHWKTVWKKPKAKLDKKRQSAIKIALKQFTADDLCTSLTGYGMSAFHRGGNEQKTVYDEITLHLRDAAHVEAGLDHCKRGPTSTNPKDPYAGSI